MGSKPKDSVDFRDKKAMEMFYQNKEYHREEALRTLTEAQGIIQSDITAPGFTGCHLLKMELV